jgi:enoyl-CoA hydratase/carnithine racemase
VGVQTALQMMLTSKPLKAPAAAKAGLVDKLVQGRCREHLALRSTKSAHDRL